MKFWGVVLLVAGLAIGGFGVWKKMNGGPVIIGYLTNDLLDVYGGGGSGTFQIVIGVIAVLVGGAMLIGWL